MTAPGAMRVNPDQLRALGSEWYRLADAIGQLDPAGAVAAGAGGLGGSTSGAAMPGGASTLTTGVTRTAARFRQMAQAARSNADSVEATDAAFAAALRRIDGGR